MDKERMKTGELRGPKRHKEQTQWSGILEQKRVSNRQIDKNFIG